MRILHTSDWHLGRSFHRVNLISEQSAYLDHLVEVVRSEQVDVVLVAGDVYDRALPPVDVVQLLDEALARLVAAGAQVVLSSGNHDSARRLGFGARLMEAAGVHLRTAVQDVARPVLLKDQHGPVALYPLPYLEPAVTAGALACERSHQAVLSAATDRARGDLAARRARAARSGKAVRSVVAAHAFVVGGVVSDSERDLSVGGAGQVGLDTFAGFDYVALGHLHGRQRLAEHARYAGSPLAYSFSEAGHRKGGELVVLGPAGVESVTTIPAPVPRGLRCLRGPLSELLHDPSLAAAESSWCQVTLTDPIRPREAMTQLRRRFPHTLDLRFEPDGGALAPSSSYVQKVRRRSDLDVCCSFLDHVRGAPATPAETEVLAQALEHARRADPEERTGRPETDPGRERPAVAG